jgi:hypothetical protein
MTNLFQLGDFKLASGTASRWKLECDALTDDDIAALAYMIRQMVGPYGSVEGVPRGGIRLADALKPYCETDGKKHLIVDDVLTTGGSMERIRGPRGILAGNGVIGAVVFARGRCPTWIRALFQMPECFWVKPSSDLEGQP